MYFFFNKQKQLIISYYNKSDSDSIIQLFWLVLHIQYDLFDCCMNDHFYVIVISIKK